MISRTTSQFWKAYHRLPQEIQENADLAYQIWRDNPYQPSLQFKRINVRAPIYSVRVGKGYRALGLSHENTIIWFWIGGHDDYLRILREQ